MSHASRVGFELYSHPLIVLFLQIHELNNNYFHNNTASMLRNRTVKCEVFIGDLPHLRRTNLQL